MSDDPTPRALGFRMPAEWEPHDATWVAWPHNREDWPGKLSSIHWVYVEIVRHLCRGELVRVITENGRQEARIRGMLKQARVGLSRVAFHRMATDRSWLRDSGPTFLTNDSELGAACWRFNAWARYSDWKRDNKVADRVAGWAGARAWHPRHAGRRIVLEGGSVDVNGRGTLLTTEDCLLGTKQQRNPGLSKGQVEQILGDYLNARRVVWLGGGIVGDDTGGHVDDIARFVRPRTVVAAVEPNREDPNHAPLKQNLRRLRAARDQDGRRLDIVELPMPRPLYFEHYRLPASYANFYIANGLVLVPTFNDPNDRVALNTLEKLFPEREVVGIHSVDLAWGFGMVHCSTQQQPAVG